MKTLLLPLLLLLASPLLAAESAPPITLTNDDGDPVNLPRSHDGVDIYLFWATWCPYCKSFMPHVQSIVDEYGDAVTVFALQIRDDEDAWEYMERNGFDFVLIPEADAAMEPYGMRSTPGVLLVDGEGKIRFNLYDIVFDDPPDYEDLSNSAKAARRAPAWAAILRKEIDAVLN